MPSASLLREIFIFIYMEKQKIVVPKGIRYLGDWTGFTLPTHPCIINKTITGCGFTEFCLRSSLNVILCSPRKILLENKEEQHSGNVYYVKNNLEHQPNFEKDLNKNKEDTTEIQEETPTVDVAVEIRKLKGGIKSYISSCIFNKKPCKILVTYDSFRLVKDSINELDGQGIDLSQFYVVVDEWQAIFVDSTFKSSTEIDFVAQLQGLNNLCFVSATPMIDKYLEMMDEFKNLPYYELDWATEDPLRVSKPFLDVHPSSKSIIAIAADIIEQYRKGNTEVFAYRDKSGNICEVKSKEAVFFVNSVKNICDIIRKSGLTLDEANILCSREADNNKKVKAAFGLKGKGTNALGEVPLKGEPHKMFTLCTRTVYLGADFYSTNAKSYIFSDANIDCLTVDITLDLPQILGRQRLECNPWKSRAELYYKTLASSKEETLEELKKRIDEKERATMDILVSYESTPDENKHSVAAKYQRDARNSNYKYDYVAVNTHSGKDLVPVFNKLVKIAELRNYEIQQVDYKNRFTVMNSLNREGNNIVLSKIDEIVQQIEDLSGFPAKMQFIYESELPEEIINVILGRLPIEYGNFYRSVSPEEAKRLSYRKGWIEKRYEKHLGNQSVDAEELNNLIFSEFAVGNKYTRSEIKDKLEIIYNLLDYIKTPKALDLEGYFELRTCLIQNKETGKRDHGFEIIKKKEGF